MCPFCNCSHFDTINGRRKFKLWNIFNNSFTLFVWKWKFMKINPLYSRAFVCVSTFRHCHTTVFDVHNNYEWYLNDWENSGYEKLLYDLINFKFQNCPFTCKKTPINCICFMSVKCLEDQILTSFVQF